MASALPWVIQSAQGWEKKWEREMGERRREGVRPSVRGLGRVVSVSLPGRQGDRQRSLASLSLPLSVRSVPATQRERPMRSDGDTTPVATNHMGRKEGG